MLKWRVPLFGPTWKEIFEAFRAALHGSTRPTHDALLAGLTALEAAYDRDWHSAFAYAIKAHSLQPNGLWQPLLEVTQPPFWRWLAFWTKKATASSLFPTPAPDHPSGAHPQQPNLT
jgi:hypothetical protein